MTETCNRCGEPHGCISPTNPNLIEALAALEHDQWMEWSEDIANTEVISHVRLQRWRTYWKPYDELPEDVKEHDRVWARRVIGVMREVDE